MQGPPARTRIRQQPKLGRTCGLVGSQTRRMLDPPLILEADYKALEAVDVKYLDHNLICKISLRLEDGTIADYLVAENSPKVKQKESHHFIENLVGNKVQNGQFLNDSFNPKEEKKLLFVFPDLGVRLSGTYFIRCCFCFMDDSTDHFSIDTHLFDVFNSRQYPGNQAATELSKVIHSQGINVRGGIYSKTADISQSK